MLRRPRTAALRRPDMARLMVEVSVCARRLPGFTLPDVWQRQAGTASVALLSGVFEIFEEWRRAPAAALRPAIGIGIGHLVATNWYTPTLPAPMHVDEGCEIEPADWSRFAGRTGAIYGVDGTDQVFGRLTREPEFDSDDYTQRLLDEFGLALGTGADLKANPDRLVAFATAAGATFDRFVKNVASEHPTSR